MEAISTIPQEAKPKKRVVARATRPQGEQKARRQKVGLLLSEEASRRLGLYALMESKDRSDIVERLIMENLKGWVVQWRGAPAATEEVAAV